jgi:Nuclear transport factor 2 (NTF2) domain
MATPDDIASHFVGTYYQLFDGNQRDQLGGLYQEESMLSFEGEKFQGPVDIQKKLTVSLFPLPSF